MSVSILVRKPPPKLPTLGTEGKESAAQMLQEISFW